MNNNRATLAGKYEERKAYMSMHTYIHTYVHKCTHDNRSRKFRLLEKVNSTLALRGIEIHTHTVTVCMYVQLTQFI